jgi:3-dehydroquinate synthase
MQELSNLEIITSTGRYGIQIGLGISRTLINDASVIVIIDHNVLLHYPHLAIKGRTITIKAEECFKTLDTVALLIEQLREMGATRKTHIVAVGGGITQDLTTFVASVYMRGLRWTYVPTTLLAMFDSCIGGKSSINVGKFKNIAGNFYPPDTVVIDPEFYNTLSTIQKTEGLCEAVKICYADNDNAFTKYINLATQKIITTGNKQLIPIIFLSLSTKKRFIEEDEFDQGARLLLNFGHTFGHAIESATAFEISHGIGVGLGMLAAMRFSERKAWISPGQPRATQLAQYLRSLLTLNPVLYSSLQTMSAQTAFASFQADKKHSNSTFTIIAFNSAGQLERREVPQKENAHLILEIFENMNNLIS